MLCWITNKTGAFRVQNFFASWYKIINKFLLSASNLESCFSFLFLSYREKSISEMSNNFPLACRSDCICATSCAFWAAGVLKKETSYKWLENNFASLLWAMIHSLKRTFITMTCLFLVTAFSCGSAQNHFLKSQFMEFHFQVNRR